MFGVMFDLIWSFHGYVDFEIKVDHDFMTLYINVECSFVTHNQNST